MVTNVKQGLCSFLTGFTLLTFFLVTFASGEMNWRQGGLTGKEVPALPTMRGDYVNVGVRTFDGHTDIPKLIAALQSANVTDYMHLVWTEQRYPHAWSDFPVMAAAFQKAGINLWLYLTPPTEVAPDPFGTDYIRWATECAKIASVYPVVKGITIDDFDQNTSIFTPAYCKRMMNEAHKTCPKLSLLVVSYYGKQHRISKHVAQGAIDGIIMPYFYPHKNLSDTTALSAQIHSFRQSLDRMSMIGKLKIKMPLIVMVYAMKMSESPDLPTSSYVKTCLDIALASTRNGLANGAITYGLPKDKPDFIEAVAASYSNPLNH